MSGRLLGEVLDAREAGLLDMLNQGEFLALLAIAEKCLTETRQASVRMARIAAAMGKSEVTAQRATRRLRNLLLIETVKPGYKSHGIGHANVYELTLRPSPKVIAAQRDGERDARGTHASPTDDQRTEGRGHQNKRVRASKAEGEGVTQGDDHDGLYDGLYDGGNVTLGRGFQGEGRPNTPLAADITADPVLSNVHSGTVAYLRKHRIASNAKLRERLSTGDRPRWPEVRAAMLACGQLIEIASGTSRAYRLSATASDPWGSIS